MTVEDLIIKEILINHPEDTSIDALYQCCRPHGQALVERKCRLIRQHGHEYEGKIYKIIPTRIGSHSKIIAWGLDKEEEKEQTKLFTFKKPAYAY
jgi:hypothetical protein